MREQEVRALCTAIDEVIRDYYTEKRMSRHLEFNKEVGEYYCPVCGSYLNPRKEYQDGSKEMMKAGDLHDKIKEINTRPEVEEGKRKPQEEIRNSPEESPSSKKLTPFDSI